MSRQHTKKSIRSESGIAYITILLLLAILSSSAVAFLNRASTEVSVTARRGEGMQAQYLAESAANHAMWRILNDPTFAPASDTYAMHPLGNGRYGYKVRMPTETTFATVATVGAIENSVVNQSYVQYVIPSNVFTVYDNSTNSFPLYRLLIGAQWTDAGDVLVNADNIHWVELEGCPIRKELVCGIIDNIGEIKVAVYDGTMWGNVESFGYGEAGYKCFDIAYESQSGKALVVSRDGAGTMIYYNIWDGTSWASASPQSAFGITSGALRLVTMASCPGNNNILVATVSWDMDLKLFHWDGAAFTDLGAIEGSTETDNYGAAQIVYERQSGDALILWTARGTIRYRVWDGNALGPELTVNGFTNDVYVLRAAEDPASDYIVLAGMDKFYDITVAVWDGDAWIDYREIETGSADNTVPCFDVAWEASGEDAVVAWAPWNIYNVRSFAWKKGTALADSAVQEGLEFQDQPLLIRLLPISGTEKIVLLGENWNNRQLRYCLWTGDRFKGDPAIVLENNISAVFNVAFDIAEADVPITGGTGTGSGASENDPPVVDAGPDNTIYLPDNDVDLDGTVTDDGLPDPPATVTTTWTMTSGPGTVTFGDASLVDTTANFSDPGEYVLKLTADDSSSQAFDEVTIIVSEPCTLLFIVGNPSILTSADTGRKGLFESWGYIVTLIDDSDSQANFDAAVAVNDVVYAGPSALGPSMLDKLTGANIGIVNEVYGKLDNFGFCSSTSGTVIAGTVSIVDNSHYITSEFAIGSISVFSSSLTMRVLSGTLAPDLQDLAEAPSSPGQPAVVALESGAQRYDGGTAPDRRVHLPYYNADLGDLTNNGETIMKRAIDWAAHKEGGCGGASGENLIFVVGDATTLDIKDTGRKALMESWGHSVTLIDDGDTQANFDAAAAAADVVYVSGTIAGGSLLDKLTGSPTPIVNEFAGKLDNFGFSSGTSATVLSDGFAQTNPLHHITEPFSGNPVTVFTASLTMPVPGGTLAPDLQNVGEVTGTLALGTLDTGATRYDGNPAPARRVHLPFAPAETTDLTADGETILQRAIEWAAGDDTGGGGGGGGDTDPPTPDPMTWASPPTADDPYSISMTATTASDPSGVKYYFECTAGGGNDSSWQDSPTYVDSGLQPSTTYTYRVKTCDKAIPPNETAWSTEAPATTPSNEIYVHDITMGFRTLGVNYYGQATVWIKGAGGENVSGAVVSGSWTGAVSGTSMGTTGVDGKVMMESPSKKNGGTFTFTVTNVVKAGYTYNPSLNVETWDSITAP